MAKNVCPNMVMCALFTYLANNLALFIIIFDETKIIGYWKGTTGMYFSSRIKITIHYMRPKTLNSRLKMY